MTLTFPFVSLIGFGFVKRTQSQDKNKKPVCCVIAMIRFYSSVKNAMTLKVCSHITVSLLKLAPEKAPHSPNHLWIIQTSCIEISNAASLGDILFND